VYDRGDRAVVGCADPVTDTKALDESLTPRAVAPPWTCAVATPTGSVATFVGDVRRREDVVAHAVIGDSSSATSAAEEFSTLSDAEAALEGALPLRRQRVREAAAA
jgi:hypothetical protein